MQPLYVDGSSPVDISWEEPALAITRSNESKRLVPLRLVSHVLVSGREVTWHQEALLARAEADIPILFTDGNNELLAALRTNTPEPSPEWRRLAKLIEDPDGVDHYRTFLKGKRTQIQLDVNERWSDLPEVRLPGYPRAARLIRIALRADLEAELHRRGFRQRTELLRDAGVDIGGDLMQLLEPYVHWLLNETWKSTPSQQPAGHYPASWHAANYSTTTLLRTKSGHTTRRCPCPGNQLHHLAR